MKPTKVLDFIHSHSWAITPQMLTMILDIASREHMDFEAVAAKRAEYVANASFTGKRDGVAVIDVIGPIFSRASMFQAISGATDVERLAEDFGAAMADSSIHSILLNVDSPGGEVSGISEFASMIRKANDIKPVHAFVQGIGASAAYWLAVAAGSVAVSDTALIGSIGVIMAMQTKEPKDGTKTYEFVSTQAPNKRPSLETEGGRAKYQSLVDSMGAVFQESVAKYRGVSLETVQQKFGEGGMFVGQEAVSRGMADKVSTFEDTLQALVQSHKNKPYGGFNMKADEYKTKFPQEYQAIFETGVASVPEKADTSKAVADEAAKVERSRIEAIESIKAPGYEGIIAANKFNPEMTKDKVSTLIMEAQEVTRNKAAQGRNADATQVAQKVEGTNASGAALENAELSALIAIAAKAASK